MKIGRECEITSELGGNHGIFALEIPNILLRNNDLGILARALYKALFLWAAVVRALKTPGVIGPVRPMQVP